MILKLGNNLVIFKALWSSQPKYTPEEFSKIHTGLPRWDSVDKLFPWLLISDSFGGNSRLLIAGKQAVVCELYEWRDHTRSESAENLQHLAQSLADSTSVKSTY